MPYLRPALLLLLIGSCARDPGLGPAGTDTDGDGFCSADDRCADGSDAGDCNDDDDSIHPGAPELCNGVDDDCSGLIDDGSPLCPVDLHCSEGLCVPTDVVPSGVDGDGDGYCDHASLCGDGTTPGDCDDEDATVHPGAEELCNGIDDNCLGDIDEGCPGCGNGVVDAGETCDDGPLNDDVAGACSTSCLLADWILWDGSADGAEVTVTPSDPGHPHLAMAQLVGTDQVLYAYAINLLGPAELTLAQYAGSDVSHQHTVTYGSASPYQGAFTMLSPTAGFVTYQIDSASPRVDYRRFTLGAADITLGVSGALGLSYAAYRLHVALALDRVLYLGGDGGQSIAATYEHSPAGLTPISEAVVTPYHSSPSYALHAIGSDYALIAYDGDPCGVAFLAIATDGTVSVLDSDDTLSDACPSAHFELTALLPQRFLLTYNHAGGRNGRVLDVDVADPGIVLGPEIELRTSSHSYVAAVAYAPTRALVRDNDSWWVATVDPGSGDITRTELAVGEVSGDDVIDHGGLLLLDDRHILYSYMGLRSNVYTLLTRVLTLQ